MAKKRGPSKAAREKAIAAIRTEHARGRQFIKDHGRDLSGYTQEEITQLAVDHADGISDSKFKNAHRLATVYPDKESLEELISICRTSKALIGLSVVFQLCRIDDDRQRLSALLQIARDGISNVGKIAALVNAVLDMPNVKRMRKVTDGVDCHDKILALGIRIANLFESYRSQMHAKKTTPMTKKQFARVELIGVAARNMRDHLLPPVVSVVSDRDVVQFPKPPPKKNQG